MTQGGVTVRWKGEGKGSMQGMQFGFFISWFLLKTYIDNQGENLPSSCTVLALQCHKANGNKIFETQRIGYFRSFLFDLFPAAIHKDFFPPKGILVFVSFFFSSLTSRFLEFQELQNFWGVNHCFYKIETMCWNRKGIDSKGNGSSQPV